MDERLKIAIADDETMVCVVIQDAIEFERLGLDLVGVAHDGPSLLNLIVQRRPDIVITDISMPGFDGLEVIKETRARNLDCKFIIISGYSQFDYARSALKHKVDDYLLKPISAPDLNETLAKLRHTILAERSQSAAVSLTLEDNRKSREALRRLFLSKLIHNHRNFDNIFEVAADHGIEFREGCFQGVSVKIDVAGAVSGQEIDCDSILVKTAGILTRKLEGLVHEMPYYIDKCLLFLVINYSPDVQKEVKDALTGVFGEIKDFIDLFKGMQVTMGLGSSETSIVQMYTTLHESELAVYYRMTKGTNRVIHYKRVAEASTHLPEEDRDNRLRELEKDFEAIDLPGFQAHLKNLFDIPRLSPADAAIFCYKTASMFFTIYNTTNRDVQVTSFSKEQLWGSIQDATSMAQLQKSMLDKVSAIMQQQVDSIQKQNAKPVREAILYIQKHYAEPLRLESVADVVMLSPAYFSSVFKKETGESFVDYLNQFRLDTAKTLLRTTNESIVNISLSVGFNDSKYFTKLFKKYVGLKPSEYRNIYG